MGIDFLKGPLLMVGLFFNCQMNLVNVVDLLETVYFQQLRNGYQFLWIHLHDLNDCN